MMVKLMYGLDFLKTEDNIDFISINLTIVDGDTEEVLNKYNLPIATETAFEGIKKSVFSYDWPTLMQKAKRVDYLKMEGLDIPRDIL